jgi:hypothetical protein
MATPNFGQVGHQRNFAVRYRADDVFLFQPAAPFNQSRPRLPASQPLDFVLLEEVLQDHAIQIVEIDPRNLALLTLAIAGPYPRRQRSVNSTQLISKPLSLPQLVASAITELRQSPTVPNVSKAPCLHTSRFEFHQAPCLLLDENSRQFGEWRRHDTCARSHQKSPPIQLEPHTKSLST